MWREHFQIPSDSELILGMKKGSRFIAAYDEEEGFLYCEVIDRQRNNVACEIINGAGRIGFNLKKKWCARHKATIYFVVPETFPDLNDYSMIVDWFEDRFTHPNKDSLRKKEKKTNDQIRREKIRYAERRG